MTEIKMDDAENDGDPEESQGHVVVEKAIPISILDILEETDLNPPGSFSQSRSCQNILKMLRLGQEPD